MKRGGFFLSWEQALRLGTLWLIFFMGASDIHAALLTPSLTDNVFDERATLQERPAKLSPEQMRYLFRIGNLDGAMRLAAQLVDSSPDGIQARCIISIYFSSTGDIEKAKQVLNAAMPAPANNLFVLYAQAMVMRLEKKLDGAMKLANESIALDPTDPYPWNILGRIYCDRGQKEQAFAAFRKSVELEPKFAPGYVNMGFISYESGDYRRSVEYFKNAVELNPSAVMARQNLAMAWEAMGNYSAAIEEMKAVLSINDDNAAAWEKLAEIQLEASKYDDALQTGEEMKSRGVENAYEIMGDAALHKGDPKGALGYLNKAPDESITARYLRGYCFMVEGRYSESLDQMEKVLQLNRQHFGAYAARAVLRFYLGRSLDLDEKTLGQWDESTKKFLFFLRGSASASDNKWKDALADWERADDLIGGFSVDGIHASDIEKGLKKGELKPINLGILYFLRNLQDAALLQFNDALKINGGSIFGNYWAAQVYLKCGNRPKAIQLLENSTKQAPHFFTAHYTIAELNLLEGKVNVAVKHYREALEVKKNAGILVKLGLIFEKSGELEKAERTYEEVTKLFPNLFVGYNQLAWFYAERGIKLNEAMSLARKADELMPGNASILDTIGWIDFQNKNYKAAIENLSKAHDIRPDNPTIVSHLQVAYEAVGDKANAHKYQEMAAGLSKSTQSK